MNIILGEGAVKLSLEQWLNWGTENTSVTCLRLEAKSSTNWGAHSLVQLTLNVSMGQALSPVASCTYFYSIEGVVEEWEKKGMVTWMLWNLRSSMGPSTPSYPEVSNPKRGEAWLSGKQGEGLPSVPSTGSQQPYQRQRLLRR